LNSNKRIILVVLVVVLLGASATAALFLLSRGGVIGSRPLPEGCTKPGGGFLIIASSSGYNDSIAHGSPAKSWPIVTVHLGQNVTIVVCNTDVQAHGFQIVHYFTPNQETLVPGQVLRVSFIADQTGSFVIYCDIFCSIHIYMQNGLLSVTA
jgi:hypothetical protein